MSHLLRFLLLLAAALSGVSVAEVPKELPAGAPSPVGYATVSAALRDLQSRKDVEINVTGGWTIINDPVNNIIWSFAPASHPAYPSVVKRTLIQTTGGISLNMAVLCEAATLACENLVKEFQALNERAKQSLQR
jgi:hypothetical protein